MTEPYTPARHLALAIAYGQCATRTEPDGSLVITHPEEMIEHRWVDPEQQSAFARRVRTREAADEALDLLARCADVIAACIEMPGMAAAGTLHDEIRALLARVDGQSQIDARKREQETT